MAVCKGCGLAGCTWGRAGSKWRVLARDGSRHRCRRLPKETPERACPHPRAQDYREGLPPELRRLSFTALGSLPLLSLDRSRDQRGSRRTLTDRFMEGRGMTPAVH